MRRQSCFFKPRHLIARSAFCAAAIALGTLGIEDGQAVCMWAEVGGERLGVVGKTTGPYSTALSTLDRPVTFDTQSDGKAVFFGYVANQVKLTRASAGERPYVYEFGTAAREMTGGGWTKHGDLSGKHNYQPSWMLMQSPMITRVYACQPHKGGAGDFRMGGGQGAEWSTSPIPWIHDVQFYRNNTTRLEVTGYGVVYGGVNRNFVSLIDVDERWPCEILKDFSLPTGMTAVKSLDNGKVSVLWETRWGCGRADGGPEPRMVQNRAPSVTFKAEPDKGEPTLNTTFTAAANDPEGDEVEYRFRLPGGQWTPWGPNPSVRDQFDKVGTYTAEVQAMDINENLSEIVKTKVTVEEPAWDALVLYRRVAEGNSGSWDYHVSGRGGFLTHAPKDRLEEMRQETQDNSRAYVRRTGDLIGGIQYGSQFMTGLAKDMALWIWNNKHKELTSLVRNKHEDDGIIILSKLNTSTGKREYKMGLWENFAPNAIPLRDKTGPDSERGLSELKNQWQSDDDRFVRVGGNSYKVNVVGYQYSSSPVILDLSGKGVPDLLAGGHAWKKNRKGQAAETALRKFNLDGNGVRDWEWVGPTAGILVWGGDRSGPVAAERLFGNRTWGKDWADGYRPLAILDKDKDGWLRGEEAKDIYIWVDANSNASNEPGEIKSLGEHSISEIAVQAERDGEGNAWIEAGFRREDGSTGRSWDWWSLAGPLTEGEPANGATKSEPSVYAWGPLDKNGPSDGGVFIFTADPSGKIDMVSILPIKDSLSQDGTEGAMLGLPFSVEKDGARLRWKSVRGDTEILTSAVIDKGDIVGVTRMVRNGEELSRYGWAAKPVSGPKL